LCGDSELASSKKELGGCAACLVEARLDPLTAAQEGLLRKGIGWLAFAQDDGSFGGARFFRDFGHEADPSTSSG